MFEPFTVVLAHFLHTYICVFSAAFCIQQHEHVARVHQCSQEQSSEVALTPEEANALTNNGVSSLARLAFAACAPGQTPTDDQLTALLRPVPLNPGNAASLKRLIFEAQTLICSEVKSKAGKREDSSQVSFAAPERDARIVQQRNRLTGLRFKGEEECSHASYDLVLAVLEKDCLTYLGPEKFPTRLLDAMSSCKRSPVRKSQ